MGLNSIMNKDQIIKEDWFNKFHIGNDEPGERHWRDDDEQRAWERIK